MSETKRKKKTTTAWYVDPTTAKVDKLEIVAVVRGMAITNGPTAYGVEDCHRTELSAVQDAATRLEAISERKRLEASEATECARKMRERAIVIEANERRERAKTLEQGQ
jgi:hypothetical protein